MGALRVYMVGNDKSIETTWTGGLDRSLHDRHTKVQFWLQLLLQLKANFKMTGVFSQSPPLSQKGKWAAISPQRELVSLHRLTKASVGNLPASGLSLLPTLILTCEVWHWLQQRQLRQEEVLGRPPWHYGHMCLRTHHPNGSLASQRASPAEAPQWRARGLIRGREAILVISPKKGNFLWVLKS